MEELDRKRELALTALQEKLNDARKDRPEMVDEITVIERALEMIEDLDNYVERFIIIMLSSSVSLLPPNPVIKSVRLFSVVCPVATDTKGVEKSPASTVATKAEYTKLGRYIIHKIVASYLRSIFSL